jgi:hypothetical protein
MKKVALLLSLLTAGAFGILAQSPLGFAGTWLLDEEASFLREEDRKAYDNFVLEITENDEAITIKITYTMMKRLAYSELKLFKDGRGEENMTGGRFRVTSRTEVKDRKIVRTYNHSGIHPGGKPKTEGVETFILSKNGTKLTKEKRQVLDNSSHLRNIPGISEHLAADMSTLVFRRKT